MMKYGGEVARAAADVENLRPSLKVGQKVFRRVGVHVWGGDCCTVADAPWRE